MNNPERQDTFGWLVSVDLFLAGTGAALFTISIIFRFTDFLETVQLTGFFLGLILVFIGTLLLVIDLGKKSRFYRVIFNPSSWMTRGAWSITAFLIFGFVYTLFQIPDSDIGTSVPVVGTGIAAVISALMVMIYTGLLLFKAKRIPFWNTPVLPVTFLFSSACSGMALVLIIAAASLQTPNDHFRTAVIIEIALVAFQVLALALMWLFSSRTTGAAAQSALALFRDKSFLLAAIIAGMFIPFGLLLFQAISNSSLLPALIAGSLLLVGGAVFRYGILRSGIRIAVTKEQLVFSKTIHLSPRSPG